MTPEESAVDLAFLRIMNYTRLGFVPLRHFPNEYLLIYHPQTLAHVRLYCNGQVWEKSEATGGDYVRHV